MKLLINLIKSKNSIYITTDSELYLQDMKNMINQNKDFFENYNQIISLKRGVLWKIKVNSGNIESVLIKILKSVTRIFF